MERGFDYALTQHQLGVRHSLRQATDPTPQQAEEPGKKCTLWGLREALRNDRRGSEKIGDIRQSARQFWMHRRLDPEEAGEERLCAICATKRFLVEADGDEKKLVFNRLWGGMNSRLDEIRDDDGELRVPFPATATVAAQDFIARLLRAGRYKSEMTDVVSACRKAGLEKTSFARALPRLAAVARDSIKAVQEFLKYEAEDVLFHEALDGKIRGAERNEGRGQSVHVSNKGLRDLKQAVRALRSAARKDCGSPDTAIAVIRLDGDQMRQLLIGHSDAIATKWRDVLRPAVRERLPSRRHLMDAGWSYLLDCKRLMGPSLHAFVSRALGHFSHQIVPWVVEREFSGRLVYAGGDDVLCIAPASEAIDLAARLQQLFSAAWVVDRGAQSEAEQDGDFDPQINPWAWRRADWPGDWNEKRDRQRFVIPLVDADHPIHFDDPGQAVAAHAAEAYDKPDPKLSIRGLLLPLLGEGASLSAGIAIGHYKTPLSVLLTRSKELLDFAK
jgi:CRISPR-associated protein Cmr2